MSGAPVQNSLFGFFCDFFAILANWSVFGPVSTVSAAFSHLLAVLGSFRPIFPPFFDPWQFGYLVPIFAVFFCGGGMLTLSKIVGLIIQCIKELNL